MGMFHDLIAKYENLRHFSLFARSNELSYYYQKLLEKFNSLFMKFETKETINEFGDSYYEINFDLKKFVEFKETLLN